MLQSAWKYSVYADNRKLDIKFCLKVSNYYEGQLKKDGSGDYVTGKGDKINHGLGLKSVRTIVESYGGLMEISSEDFIFQVSILI